MISTGDITALVLAGGRGTRMGGVDKGLQSYHGQSLAEHTAQRIAPQVAGVMLNANRHLEVYRALGWPVWSDVQPQDHAGPLAGFAAGLEHCPTPWLLALPCDTPLFPLDLAARLAGAAAQAGAPIAMACAPDAENGGRLRVHAVFCLMHVALLADLQAFLAAGGRRVRQWSERHGCALATFDRPSDAPQAFANANTLAELAALQDIAAG